MGGLLLRNGWIERRDGRNKVLIRARMRANGLPVDICICDISPRGACIMTARPPERGTIIELIDLPIPIVGKVAWSGARRFGLAAGSRIDVRKLLSQHRGEDAGQPVAAAKTLSRRDLASREERSRRVGKSMEYALIVFAGAVIAAAFGEIVYSKLGGATQAAQHGMEQSPSPRSAALD